MIKANELRIGNFVNLYVPNGKGQAITGYNNVTQISSEYIWLGDGFRCKQEDIKPISLTEEILLKCGFELIPPANPEFHLWSDYVKDEITITLPYFEFVFNGGEGNIEIKYLHQLQNLYFAITGKELEVKI